MLLCTNTIAIQGLLSNTQSIIKLRFTLSYRDMDELMALKGVFKFSTAIKRI